MCFPPSAFYPLPSSSLLSGVSRRELDQQTVAGMGSALLSGQYSQRWQSLDRPWDQRAGAPLIRLLEIVPLRSYEIRAEL
jgi:hypothetical protein